MPLTGIRVLDLTRLLPGAFCTMLLADMGADVIKVEEPGTGDYMRWMPLLIEGQSVLFNALNRNKRSLTLNLKSEAGRELLLRLVDGSDVLVEGNRPGVMERLGVGWAVIHARNPALIMCSIPGYGQDGPMAARAGHDINYVATAGVLGLNGSGGAPPSPLGVQVGDVGGGGLQPAVAILGALVGVQRGDEGRWLDVSMTDGAVSWLALALAQQGAGEEWGRGDQRLAGRYACYRVYECKDGRFYSVGALELKFWTELCGVLGSPTWSSFNSRAETTGSVSTRRWNASSSRKREPSGSASWPVSKFAASRCSTSTRWLRTRRSRPGASYRMAPRAWRSGPRFGCRPSGAVAMPRAWASTRPTSSARRAWMRIWSLP